MSLLRIYRISTWGHFWRHNQQRNVLKILVDEVWSIFDPPRHYSTQVQNFDHFFASTKLIFFSRSQKEAQSTKYGMHHLRPDFDKNCDQKNFKFLIIFDWHLFDGVAVIIYNNKVQLVINKVWLTHQFNYYTLFTL